MAEAESQDRSELESKELDFSFVITDSALQKLGQIIAIKTCRSVKKEIGKIEDEARILVSEAISEVRLKLEARVRLVAERGRVRIGGDAVFDFECYLYQTLREE